MGHFCNLKFQWVIYQPLAEDTTRSTVKTGFLFAKKKNRKNVKFKFDERKTERKKNRKRFFQAKALQ